MIADPPTRFKRALVTGGTGMVGAPLCNRLVALGVDVTSFSRNLHQGFVHDSVKQVTGDIRDHQALGQAVEGSDVVFHVAAAVHGSESTFDGFRLLNVVGTENVIRTAQSAGTRLVHVSTVNVEGFDQGTLMGAYAQTKAMGEQLVNEAIQNGLDAVIVRPATVFGTEPGRSGLVADRIYSGSLKILPAPSRQISPVWVEDLAVALTQAAEIGATGQTYTVAGPTMSTGNFAKSIASAVGARPYLISVPGWLVAIPLSLAWWTKAITRWIPPVTVEAVLSGSVHDGSSAANELGFSYTPISEIFTKSQLG